MKGCKSGVEKYGRRKEGKVYLKGKLLYILTYKAGIEFLKEGDVCSKK
jgi:hypothetical protein